MSTDILSGRTFADIVSHQIYTDHQHRRQQIHANSICSSRTPDNTTNNIQIDHKRANRLATRRHNGGAVSPLAPSRLEMDIEGVRDFAEHPIARPQQNQDWEESSCGPDGSYGYSDSEQSEVLRGDIESFRILDKQLQTYQDKLPAPHRVSKPLVPLPRSRSHSLLRPGKQRSDSHLTNLTDFPGYRNCPYTGARDAQSFNTRSVHRGPADGRSRRGGRCLTKNKDQRYGSEDERGAQKKEENDSNFITEVKLQELVKENVFLTREVERLTDDLKDLEKQKAGMKDEMYAGMVERHERRVKLLKEEFDFKLEEEIKRNRAQEALRKAETENTQDRCKELEARVQSLEIASQIADEKLRNEQRHVEELRNSNSSLEEQSNAALKTVSQFSEKNMQLGREIDELRRSLEQKERELHVHKVQSAQLQSDYDKSERNLESQKDEIARLRQTVDEQIETKHNLDMQIQGIDEQARHLSQVVLDLKQDVTNRDLTIGELQEQLLRCQTQKRELGGTCKELQARMERYMEVSERCSSEAMSFRQENEILRRRLEEQLESLRYFKQFALRHNVAPLTRHQDGQPPPPPKATTPYNLSLCSSESTATRSSFHASPSVVKQPSPGRRLGGVSSSSSSQSSTFRSSTSINSYKKHDIENHIGRDIASSPAMPSNENGHRLMMTGEPCRQGKCTNEEQPPVDVKKRSSTRLVKVMSQSGNCRYELRHNISGMA